MHIEMHNPQSVIFEELAQGATKESVALTYAVIIRQEGETAEWAQINEAIRCRWKGKGALDQIKKLAWRFLTEQQQKQVGVTEG